MKRSLLQAIALGVLPLGSSVHAADVQSAQTTSDRPYYNYNWTGFYLGGHVGYGRAFGDISVHDPVAMNTSPSLGSLFGGLQFGYNYVLPSRVMIGIETDFSMPNAYPSDAQVWRGTTPRSVLVEQLDYIATLRGRFGYAFDKTLLYATGGFAVSSSHFGRIDPNSGDEQLQPGLRTGWVVGGGIEYAFQQNWNARVEYLYSSFGSAGTTFANGAQYASSFDTQIVRLGLNRKLGDLGSSDKKASDEGGSLSDSDRWEIHGQTTYIQQGYPRFHALYTGENSLPPWPQSKETFTMSAFLGLRLWDGGELYYNPELLQGFGLSSTVGAAGFPNGEAQKSDFIYPH